MSIGLVVEVLDHYHGPHARKLWLIAWAEKVKDDGSRTGYCKRDVLVARLGRSPSRVSGIARELEDEGTIKRLGGGVWGKSAVYELLPLDTAQGQPRADPTQGQPRADPTAEPGPNSQGQPRADAQGQPRADPNPHNPHKPSSARARGRGPADIIRAAYPDATDDEIDTITKDRINHGARSAEAVLAYEAREGTLRLPCDRNGPGRHSNACRDGEPGGCGTGWCTCRCHTEPAASP